MSRTEPSSFICAGVPLPGETILVAAALLAATTNQIDIAVVVAAAAIGAIIGDGIGYTVGRRFGTPFLRKYGRYIRLDENRLLIGRYLFFRYGNLDRANRRSAAPDDQVGPP